LEGRVASTSCYNSEVACRSRQDPCQRLIVAATGSNNQTPETRDAEMMDGPAPQFSPELRRELALVLSAYLTVSTTAGDERMRIAAQRVGAWAFASNHSPQSMVQGLRNVYDALPGSSQSAREERRQYAFDQFVEKCVIAYVNARDAR
jgi:hypothetical protein